MAEINEVDGVITMEGNRFSMKVDKSRKIYVKDKDKDSYSYIDFKTPEGMTSGEKKKFLYEIYRRIEAKLSTNTNI